MFPGTGSQLVTVLKAGCLLKIGVNVVGVEVRAPELEALVERLITELRRTGDKVTDSEQQLTDEIRALKTSITGMEERVESAEAALKAGNDQLAATNATLKMTVATLQTQIDQGNIGGVSAPVVAQALADLKDETAEVDAFLAPPAPPTAEIPAAVL
jgi:chromosome segregation ATPase